MEMERLTYRQSLFCMMLFCFGSSVIMGISTEAEHDTWMSILLGALISVPFLIVYARIIKLFPEKNLFQIADTLFGKIAGKAIAALFIWYAIHLCALVLRNFSEFMQITMMPETPQLPIMILMMLITVYLAKSGMRTLGKWSVVVLPIVLFMALFTVALAMAEIDLSHILPFMEHKAVEIVGSAVQVAAFPYGELVLFLCIACTFRKQISSYKIFLRSLAVMTAVFLLVFLRNLQLLGDAMMKLQYFPSYVAVRIIQLGDFLSRIEGSISMNFILAGITKIAICLLAGAKGIAYLFDLPDYKRVAMPVGLLALALCAIVYNNTMEMFAFIDYYHIYAFPFQVLIPLALWIAGEIHVKRSRRHAPAGPSIAHTQGR